MFLLQKTVKLQVFQKVITFVKTDFKRKKIDNLVFELFFILYFISSYEYNVCFTGKTAPVTQVRKYDREFLLQLRYKPICLQKPAGLPDHEIFLDRPVMPHKGAGSQR